jgi:transcription initiation factor IIF auxiliary subunit
MLLFKVVCTDVWGIAIEEPPFEVTETGWGEFEIQIKIYFSNEASEKPMTLFHFLHLHPYGPNKEEERDKGLTVEAMQYEEIVHPHTSPPLPHESLSLTNLHFGFGLR